MQKNELLEEKLDDILIFLPKYQNYRKKIVNNFRMNKIVQIRLGPMMIFQLLDMIET